jgi:hypothetical protein
LASTTLRCTVHLRARRTVGRFGNLRYSRLGSLRYGGRVKMHPHHTHTKSGLDKAGQVAQDTLLNVE